MSNARKLQTEIDRVMKKVDEGVELFDEIWEKVYSAEQQNQKEKYEVDLKKEIKKLQRLRDQIKTWIGGSDVKDKEPLMEARRLIETKMEQFKICEKETKTKTYSKEGLARAEKVDPAEEAKRSTTKWIADYVSRFQELVEDREVEIERLMAGKGKKTNKHIIEEYNQYVTSHKFHITKLEGIARLVNNDVLDVEVVDPLKEDLDYYLDSYEDDDYQQAYDEEFFYDALWLDDLDVVNVDRVTNVAAPPKKKEDDAASNSSTKGSKEKKPSKKSSLSSVIPLTIGRARASSGKSATGSDKDNNSSHSSKEFNEPTTIPAVVPTTIKGTPNKTAGNGRVASGGASVPTPTTIPQARAAVPPATGGGASMAAILKRETEQQERERQKARQAELLRQQQQQQQQQQLQRQQQEALRQQQQQQQQQQQEALQRQQQQEAALRQQQQQQQQHEALRQHEAANKQLQQQQAAQQQAAVAQQQVQQHSAVQQVASGDAKQQQLQAQTSQGSTIGGGSGALDILSAGLGGLNLAGVVGMDVSAAPGSTQNGTAPGSSSAGINSSNSTSSGAASFGNTGGNGGAVGNETGASAGSSYLSALNEGFATMPNATDNERSRQYSPQNPYPTPSSYPASPSGIFENPAIFEKLGTDCLFFIFYYAQGTYQQYLAARELKKQSWRFHKKYMTWFQRHEEPKVTTDEYEQGTYVYFDYETGWCTRIKTDFRFEYSYLEDSLQ